MNKPAFPVQFVETAKARLADDWGDFVAAHQQEPPVSIRLNPQKKITLDRTRVVPWTSLGRYLDRRPAFTHDPVFHAGAYYVQEASSMFLELAFLQVGGDSGALTILDLCAAPGGKSTHLLSLMAADSMLVSNEVIHSRAAILAENIQKWGHHNVIVTSNDPQKFSTLKSLFDIAVVDAPCSGEGMFRKDPDAIALWSPENVVLCGRRQNRILQDVWPAIKPGGYLIYSTCTYNETENEAQLTELLAQGDAQSVKLQVNPSWNITEVAYRNVYAYRFYPHKTLGEGLFMAVLRKISEGPANGLTVSGTQPRLKPAQEQQMREWITSPAAFFSFKDEIRMIPEDSEKLLQLLTKHLYLVNAGTLVGTAKANKVIPGHALALSVHLNHEQWPAMEVDYDTAIRYLRKEAIAPDNLPRGFGLVKYKGLALGWINVLDTRANNLYPPGWRIRTTALPE